MSDDEGKKKWRLDTCLHDDLLRAQTAIRLHFEVEFLRLPLVVERLVVAWGFFFRCVCA